MIFDHIGGYFREMNATIFSEVAARGQQLFTGRSLKKEITFD
jgi:hypothetical protein